MTLAACAAFLPMPALHGVYTVDGFTTSAFCEMTQISLVEYPPRGKMNLSFDIVCFRPAVDRDTDISALVEIARKQSDRVPFEPAFASMREAAEYASAALRRFAAVTYGWEL
jgi:hypothetical protein